MGFLQKHYEKLSTRQLKTERLEIQNRIENNDGRVTTGSSNELDYDLDKHEAIDNVLIDRHNNVPTT